MSNVYVYFDDKGNACVVEPDCVSLHSDGCYYDDKGHNCHPVLDGIVSGTSGNDVIDINYTGDPQGDRIDHNDAILGNVGSNDDIVYAYGGNDTVKAGEANDTVYGGEGRDVIYGGSGNDALYGDAGDDNVNGDAGNDTLYGGDGNDKLNGNDGNDLIYGGPGNDDITGGAGNDTIYGGPGNEQIDAGTGDDLVHGDSENDKIVAGDGKDTVYGDAGNDDLRGGAGEDSLFGGDGLDQMRGEAGNDTLDGGASHDEMFGGDDRDLFIHAGVDDLIDGDEGGNDFDTLDLTGAGPLSVAYNPGNPESGKVTFYDADHNVTGTLTFKNIECVIPCFTPGTLVATPRGEVPVEDLQAGDRVITRDNGLQEIRWVGQRDLEWADLLRNEHLKPVLIRAGALGHGLPERDMLVSPNHRMLVANDRTQLYFDEHEVLVSAKHLVGTQGISSVDVAKTSYIHFLCVRHEVVLANGAWTESFQPGDYSLGGMGNAQRLEIYELFPELKTDEGIRAYAAARRTLKRHEALLAFR